MITIESAWDDETRGRALRLAEWETTAHCPCGSGLPFAECTKNQAFFVDKQIHYGRRALENVVTKERENAERDKRPDGWDHGYRYYVKVHKDDEEA